MQEISPQQAPNASLSSANDNPSSGVSARPDWRAAAQSCAQGVKSGMGWITQKTFEGAMHRPGAAGTFAGTLYLGACANYVLTPYVGLMTLIGGTAATVAIAAQEKGQVNRMTAVGAALLGAGLSGAVLGLVKESVDPSAPPIEDIVHIVQGVCPDQLVPGTRFPISRPEKAYVPSIASVAPPDLRRHYTVVQTANSFSYKSFWTGKAVRVTDAPVRVTVDPLPPGAPCHPLRNSYEVTLR